MDWNYGADIAFASAAARATGARRGLVIVSQVRFVRESLSEVLGRENGWTILGLCRDLIEASAACRDLRPDAVLLDASFPDGHRAVSSLRAAAAGCRIVAFALVETEDNVISWAEAGIAGYVPSTAGMAELATMLGAVMDGAQCCSARVAAGLFRRLGETGARRADRGPADQLAALTSREQQIITMIGTGMSNKDIARRLNIGLATTKTHVHNLLVKLNLQRRGQAAALAHQQTVRLPPVGM